MTTKFGVFTETRSHAADPYIDTTKTDARQQAIVMIDCGAFLLNNSNAR